MHPHHFNPWPPGTIPPIAPNTRLSAFQPVHVQKVKTELQQTGIFEIQPNTVLHPSSTLLDHTASAAAHLETIVSNMGTSKQGHLCIYCGKLYSRKYGLKIHIRTHTGFKPLKCKYCFRPFGDPSNLNKHVRLHVQGNTVYKCPECDKILVRRRDLQRHIQARHTILPGMIDVGGSDNRGGAVDDGKSESSRLSVYSGRSGSSSSSACPSVAHSRCSSDDDEDIMV